MTVRELLSRIDSRELSEWMMYEKETGPFGDVRLDYLMARLAATVVRSQVPKASDQAKIKDDQFLIKWNGGGAARDGDDSESPPPPRRRR